MPTLTMDHLRSLMAHHEPPCISLYQATHRRFPDSRQDSIRFRNQVKVVEESLRHQNPNREVQPLLEPFLALVNNGQFWEHSQDGLAVLASPGDFNVYRLQQPVPDMVVVADSYHTKPLLRIVQSADRYHVLCVSRRGVKLLQGNRDTLDEVELKDIPRRVAEVRGEEQTSQTKEVTSFGNELGSPFTAEGGPAIYQGHGARHDDVAGDSERFFRAVDREILEHHSRPSGLPLILAALPENQAYYRHVSHNPFLVEKGIEIDPFSLSAEELRERSWRVAEPQYPRLAGLVEEYGGAKSRGLGDDDPVRVAVAAATGRVGKLLVEADRHIPGRVDGTTGRVEFGNPGLPDDDDLLDDFAELVLKAGGQVLVVPADQMPTKTGLAATYQF